MRLETRATTMATRIALTSHNLNRLNRMGRSLDDLAQPTPTPAQSVEQSFGFSEPCPELTREEQMLRLATRVRLYIHQLNHDLGCKGRSMVRRNLRLGWDPRVQKKRVDWFHGVPPGTTDSLAVWRWQESAWKRRVHTVRSRMKMFGEVDRKTTNRMPPEACPTREQMIEREYRERWPRVRREIKEWARETAGSQVRRYCHDDSPFRI